MELTYYGGNAIRIDVKKDTFIIDGRIEGYGAKDVVVKDAVYIATQDKNNPVVKNALTISGPGEYEVRNVSVKGVAAKRMIDYDETRKATMYRIGIGGISIAVLGHVSVPLSDDELEGLGLVDIAIVPVGGNGYTLDAAQAAAVVGQLEPKVVIPTHYADQSLTYEVPQNNLEEFTRAMGGENEKLSSFKIKGDVLPVKLTVVEIERS